MTLSDRDGGYKFIVCRVDSDVADEMPDAMQYEIRQMFGHETYEEHVDSLDGSKCVVFKRDGEVIDTAGEFCGEFIDRGEARIHMNRLQKVFEVMDT